MTSLWEFTLPKYKKIFALEKIDAEEFETSAKILGIKYSKKEVLI